MTPYVAKSLVNSTNSSVLTRLGVMPTGSGSYLTLRNVGSSPNPDTVEFDLETVLAWV